MGSKKENAEFIDKLKLMSIITIICSIIMLVIGWFWSKNKGTKKENEENENENKNKIDETDNIFN